jgi:ketosteroid isomerase-like protein
MSRQNVELMSKAFAAFNRGDVDTLAALSADDIEIVPLRAALEGTVYRGSDAPYRFWSEAVDSWSELHIEIKEIHDLGDCAVAAGILRGRSRETGMELDARLGWVLAFRDGLITQIRTCPGAAEALEAAGARD